METRKTNFETIEGTMEAMVLTARRGLPHIKEMHRIVEAIAKGHSPKDMITSKRIYDGDYKTKLNFAGLIEYIENMMDLLWEYRQDINTLEGEQKPEPKMYQNQNVKFGKPEISQDPGQGYAHQEIQEFIEGRWEGFVTLISSEAGYKARLKEWELNTK